ncbi:rubredoxin [Chloroflexota bacterium]
MARYQCSACGWIYEPELGDPVGSIAPRTPFEKLPDDWVCPICEADKSNIEKIG